MNTHTLSLRIESVLPISCIAFGLFAMRPSPPNRDIDSNSSNKSLFPLQTEWETTLTWQKIEGGSVVNYTNLHLHLEENERISTVRFSLCAVFVNLANQIRST